MPIKQIKVKSTKDVEEQISQTKSTQPPKKPPLVATDSGEKSKYSELNGKMLHIKVGSPSWDNQTVETEVNKVEEKVLELLEENNVDCLVLVTHYAVDVKLIEPANPKKGISQR